MSVMVEGAAGPADAGLRFCPKCAAPLVRAVLGERPRLTCPSDHWTHWDNPLPVLAALVEYEGRILLARNAAWPEKTFSLITGFMERDETPEQGVARELKEETNLDTQATALIGVYEFMRRNELIIAYHVRATGTIRLSDELVECRLVVPEKMRAWRTGTGYAMADWLRSRGFEPEFLDWPGTGQNATAAIS